MTNKYITNKDEIVEAVDLVELCEYLGVDTYDGRLTKIRCPVHVQNIGREDKHIGNCYINEEHTRFVCKSCGGYGDAITLVEAVNGYNFYEALKLLSQFTGISLKSNEEKLSNTDIGKYFLNSKERQLLGIENKPVYVSQPIDDYEKNAEFIEVNDNRDGFYIKQQCICKNPLKEFMTRDFEEYKQFIREKIEEAIIFYDSERDCNIFRDYAQEQISKLKKMYHRFDGDMEVLNLY